MERTQKTNDKTKICLPELHSEKAIQSKSSKNMRVGRMKTLWDFMVIEKVGKPIKRWCKKCRESDHKSLTEHLYGCPPEAYEEE